MTPREARSLIRTGRWEGWTVYKLPGYVQCNLVLLPQADAYDFLVYCQRNPKPCPLLEVTDPGDPEPRRLAPGADLRTDQSSYNVFRHGELVERRQDIRALWRPDLVAFLIGSSLSFDALLERTGIPLSREVWVLRTAVATVPAGRFRGPLVVTMRWMTPAQAILATQLTARFPAVHGAPIHVGDPAAIGADLAHPLNGSPVERIPDGVMPVFWACGVTPQEAARQARPEFMLSHTSGHGFLTDVPTESLSFS